MAVYVRMGRNTGAWFPRGPSGVVFNRIDATEGSVWHAGRPTRLTSTSSGAYRVIAHARFGNPVGETLRVLGILLNGVDWIGYDAVPAPIGAQTDPWGRGLHIDMMLYFWAGDYIELGVYHNGNSSLWLAGPSGITQDSPIFCLNRIIRSDGTQQGVIVYFYRGSYIPPSVIPGGAAWTLPFDVEEMDTSGTGWSARNPTKVFCRDTGIYQVVARATFSWSSAGQYRNLMILKNGVSYPHVQYDFPFQTDTGLGQCVMISGVLSLAYGDYIELAVQHDANTDLYVYGASVFYAARLGMIRVS